MLAPTTATLRRRALIQALPQFVVRRRFFDLSEASRQTATAHAAYLTICSLRLAPLLGGVRAGSPVGGVAASVCAAGSGGKNSPWLFSRAKMPSTASTGIEHSRETPLNRAENWTASSPIVRL